MNNEKQLTVKEALEQGYEHYFYADEGYQSLKDIADCDFSRGDVYLVEKEGRFPFGIGSADISELLAEHIAVNYESETGCDDTEDIYNAVKAIDCSAIEAKIDEALSKFTYYKSTEIKLIP